MSTLIAGTYNSVNITRYSRGNKLGYGYKVTWIVDGSHCSISYDNEDEARAFYHLLYLSLDIE